jgi:hypothetical protein
LYGRSLPALNNTYLKAPTDLVVAAAPARISIAVTAENLLATGVDFGNMILKGIVGVLIVKNVSCYFKRLEDIA